jgi:small subunit ribosomal protein S16
MAVKIRLTRKGKKKQPTYRVVVADSRAPRDGRYIEQIGRYDPRQEPSVVEIDTERAEYWLGQGAQPSDAVRKLLEIAGAVTAKAAPAPARPTTIHVVDEAAQVAAEAEAAARAAAETTDEVDEDDPGEMEDDS